jgi:hypothetical protein
MVVAKDLCRLKLVLISRIFRNFRRSVSQVSQAHRLTARQGWGGG